jgi:uncharacterized protein (DUF433 family)
MSTVQKSLRLPEEAVKDIESLAESVGKDFSGLARDLLMEAIKMRKCPGISFADGPVGRRARIAGSGIDVWEVIAAFRGLKEDYKKLKKAYHWLNEQQVRSALSYYALHPKEIDNLITKNEKITHDEITKKFPFLAKPGTGR